MDPHGTDPASGRQTVVTICLTVMAAAFFLMLLVLISGGLLIYLVAVACAIGVFGAFHYLLWGRLLTMETAGETEEEQLRQRALSDDDPDQPEERGVR